MVSIFCCLRPRQPGRGVFGQPLSKDSDRSSSSDLSIQLQKVNLLTDEGSNLQKDLWSLCFQARIRRSSPEDYEFCQNLFKTLDTSSYETSLKSLTDQYAAHGLSQYGPRVRKILDTIHPFSDAITTFVQSDPQISALVWGSVQVLLVVSWPVVSATSCCQHLMSNNLCIGSRSLCQRRR
jgi:hypothetical protein